MFLSNVNANRDWSDSQGMGLCLQVFTKNPFSVGTRSALLLIQI